MVPIPHFATLDDLNLWLADQCRKRQSDVLRRHQGIASSRNQVVITSEWAGTSIRIMLSGLRGEDSIAELCRKEGIAQSLYYSWSKEFLEAGKKRLAGDTARQANAGEVKDLRAGLWH